MSSEFYRPMYETDAGYYDDVMTWQRRHCIECWHDMEHCATCGCHDDMPAVSNLDGQSSAKMNSEDQKKAPAANGGQSPNLSVPEGGTAQW